MSNDVLLKLSIEVAVPLWIDRLKHLSFRYRQQRGAICSQHVAEKGDIILYKSKKAGESAEAFNRLAEGIAILAFAPGGVTFCGLHFEAVADSPFDRPRSSVSLTATTDPPAKKPARKSKPAKRKKLLRVRKR